MKNLLITLTLVLTAATASASNTNIKFVTADNTAASSLCVSAAKNGLKSAVRKSHEKSYYDISCNGQSIESFAKNYKVKVEAKKVKNVSTKKFLVVPANKNSASQICAQAVKSGISSVRNTVNFNVNQVTCNGKSIYRFIKQYNNT